MAKLNLQTIFSAVDKLSGPSETMGKNVGAATEGMTKGFGKLKSVIGVAVAALATGAAANVITSFAERGDDIARNAGIIGLTAEAYQELSYAANMADVDQETFAKSAKKLSKSLGEMNQKQGILYTTLVKMNPALAVQLHNAKSNDEAFGLLADAISKETDVNKRAAMATAAFGKTGQDLIPMFEDLAGARKKAREAGGVMTDEEVAAASQLDDAVKKIKASGMGILNSTLAPIASGLAPIVAGFSDWVNANRVLINTRINQVIGLISGAVNILSVGWNSGLLPALLAGVVAFKLITGAIMTWKAVTTAATAIQTALNLAMNANPIGLIIIGVSALIGITVLLIKNWDSVVKVLKASWEVIKGVGQAFMKYLLLPINLVLDAIGGLLKLISKIPGVGDKVKPAVEALDSFQAKMNTKLTGTAGATDFGDVGERTAKRVSAAMGAPVSSNTTTTNRSQLDVNFNSLPAGTATRQSGYAPGITVNTGRQMLGGAR